MSEEKAIQRFQIPRLFQFTDVPLLQKVRKSETHIVNGFTFSFIHRLEGKWSGDLRVLKGGEASPACEATSVPCQTLAASTKVVYHPDGGFWEMRETTTAREGAATVQHLRLTPVANGTLSVQIQEADGSSDVSIGAYPVGLLPMTLKENPYGATLFLQHPTTGQLLLHEVLRISEDDSLSRVAQKYDVQGVVESVLIARERRLV